MQKTPARLAYFGQPRDFELSSADLCRHHYLQRRLRRGLIRGTLGAAGMMLVLGRPYGAFLKFVRQLFGLPSLPSTGRIEAYVARHGTLTTRISGVVIVQAGHPSREIPPVEFDECVPHIINRYCFRRTW